MADRAAGEEATRQQRQLAIAADTELRRRLGKSAGVALYGI